MFFPSPQTQRNYWFLGTIFMLNHLCFILGDNANNSATKNIYKEEKDGKKKWIAFCPDGLGSKYIDVELNLGLPPLISLFHYKFVLPKHQKVRIHLPQIWIIYYFSKTIL